MNVLFSGNPESFWFRWLKQYLAGVLVVSFIGVLLWFLQAYVDYRITAVVLLLSVSLCSFYLEIVPLLLLAVSSALLFNFFFIPPLYTFHIDTAEDGLLFFMYIVLAFVHAVLSTRIRAAESKARDKEDKEKAIALYNTVLNSLSHEMRTPLSSLIGAADTLAESGSLLNEEDRKHLYAVISESGLRLNRHVDNLLNMSRMEAGMLKINPDWCDVNELVSTCIQKYLSQKAVHNVRFEPDHNLPYCRIDAGLIEQVLANLLSNAVNYAGEEARIEISVAWQDGNLLIAVSDNGPGLSAADAEAVFEKFYRLPGAKRTGTGLGLSIARGVAEAHGGKLKAIPVHPKGVAFVLSIPTEASYVNKLKHE
jgi:two-component system sensor histidine kinase KdpD